MAGAKVRGITIDLGVDASGVASGLRSVNSSISSTAKELKDIDRLLKLDPSNVTLLAQRHEALQKQITQTSDKLELLKKAEEQLQAEMKDGGTEEQKKQLAALQREIISTENNLDKYTAQLNDTSSETRELANAEKQVGQATGEMGQGFTVLKGAMANLVADGIRLVVDGFKDLMTSGPAFGDEILTLASKTSLATDTLQELSYMSGLVDVDVSTVAGSLKKLTKNMDSAKGGTGSAAEAFKTLGISVTDINGSLRDNEDVFYETIDALGKVENETERDAIAMSIFGKSATDLNPMIEAGSDALKGFAEEAHEMGYVLDGDALESLAKVQDEFDRFGKQMESVKNQIASGVAPAIERAMKKLSDVVKRIDWQKIGEQMGNAFEKLIDAFEWILENGTLIKSILAGVVSAMAVQKVLTFIQSVQGMVKALKAATVAQEGLTAAMNSNPIMLAVTAIVACGAALITWQKNLNEAAEAADPMRIRMTQITDAFNSNIQAVNDNAEAYAELKASREQTIESGLSELAHVNELTQELTALADENGKVADSDKTRAEFILNELNGALGTEYTMTGNIIDQYATLEQAVADVIRQKQAEIILSSQEEAYRQAIIGRADAEQQLAQVVLDQMAAEEQRNGVMARYNEVMAEVKQGNTEHMGELIGLWNEYNNLTTKLGELDSAYETQAGIVDQYAYDITQYEGNMAAALSGDFDSIKNQSYEMAVATGQASGEASQAITANAQTFAGSWQTALGQMLTEATGKKTEFKDEGNGMVSMWVEGIKQGEDQPKSAIAGMASAMLTEADISDDMSISGYNAVAGFTNSVEVHEWMASGAGRSMADAFINAFKARMDEGSPSKVMAHSGLMAILGFTNEIEDNLRSVSEAGVDMADSFIEPFNNTMDYNAMMNGGRVAGFSGSASGSTSNVYGGTNNVTLNIYGTDGQNVNELADVVIDKLQRTIQGNEAVYA